MAYNFNPPIHLRRGRIRPMTDDLQSKSPIRNDAVFKPSAAAMRRYLLNRRSDARILLRSGNIDDADLLLEPGQEKKIELRKMAATGTISASSRPHKSRIRMARAVIKFVFAALWMWYLVVWVGAPAKAYKTTWRPWIRARTNTIYFGIQGTNILMYMIPVLSAAVLGCLYLHLGKSLSHSRPQQNAARNGNKEVSSSWKKPCLVKGPLGIVSRTELAFFAMFIILLLWSFSNYIHRALDKITSPDLDDKGRSLLVMNRVALWLGLIGNICLAFMFFPVTRGSSILPLFGLTSESSIRYHIWLGHIAMSLFTAHGTLFITYWALTGDLMQMLKWDKVAESNVAGEISLLAGIVMWLTSFPRIRQKAFELFFYTHHLYIIFIVFFMLHLGISFACMMLPGFYLFVIDRYLRFLQSQQRVKLVSARVLPCESVELNFAKNPGLNYPPTSYMFVNIPSISKLQWHPFTVCSNSDLEPDHLSVLIKSEGSWSQKLYQLLSAHPEMEHLSVSVEGPYGPASTDFLRHETLVMVSGGSGITPFMSIIRGLIQANSNGQKTPKVVLICAFKSSSDLTVLELLLPLSAPCPSTFSNLDIQIEAYVTREQESSTESSKVVLTIWFKPKNSDARISPTLGPNSWLCLAMIISSSFIMSLILIGFFTRYFIYPTDKNTDKIYPKSLKTLIYMLSFCFSIVLAASAAFMWNKRRNARDANQVNRTVSSPDSSYGSGNNDAQLESQHEKTLARVTNVHYGARPDLRRILNERGGGSSTGVLVCGPREMQRDVASVCSAGSTGNIHFEFISFSW